MRGIFSILLLMSIMVIGCNEKADKTYEGDPDDLYFDYQINGREGDDKLTILLQYRDGDEEGYGMQVKGKVMLDEETLEGDSTKMKGFYYESHKPLAEFSGAHTIHFVTGKKDYTEAFDFTPMVMAASLPDTLSRQEYAIELGGISPTGTVRILITDTSFIHNGVNRVDTLKDGKLLIAADDLAELAPGPVQIELINENERPLKNGAGSGGRLLISYSLKREFILKD